MSKGIITLFPSLVISAVAAVKLFSSHLNDPRTGEICLMVHKVMAFASLPQACPNTCERKMVKRNTQIVAKYDPMTGRCDCYNASAVCDTELPQTDKNSIFFIQGNLLFQLQAISTME